MRLKADMTMKQVATAANISESMYCLIENGNRRPSPEVAQLIGKILGFDWTMFYQNRAQKPESTDGFTGKQKAV